MDKFYIGLCNIPYLRTLTFSRKLESVGSLRGRNPTTFVPVYCLLRNLSSKKSFRRSASGALTSKYGLEKSMHELLTWKPVRDVNKGMWVAIIMNRKEKSFWGSYQNQEKVMIFVSHLLKGLCGWPLTSPLAVFPSLNICGREEIYYNG